MVRLSLLHTFILIFLFSSLVNTVLAQIEKKAIILGERSSQFWVSETFSEIEREYENSIRIIDETYSSSLVSSVDYYNKTLLKGFQLGMGFNFLKNSKNINKFESSISIDNTRSEEKSYIGNPFLEGMKKFDSVTEGHEHFFKLKYIVPLGKKEHLFLEERNIIQLSYLFRSTTLEYWVLLSEVYARYFGKIKTDKKNVGEETSAPFSEIGFNFQPTFTKWKVLITPIVGLSFTTDYDTFNQYFTRVTDKGFSYSGGVEFQYLLGRYIFSLEYFSSSYVFNMVSDDPNQDIDYEFEKRTIKLGLGTSF